MDVPAVHSDDVLDPPARIFERLRLIAGYSWDDSKAPFHSSYDNWHFFGTRFVSPYSAASSTAATSPQPFVNTASPSSLARLTSSASNRPSPSEAGSSFPPHHIDLGNDQPSSSPPVTQPSSSYSDVAPIIEEQVVARISYHVLREERGFHIAKSLTLSADPKGDHIALPLDLVRLSPLPGDKGTIIVCIYQFPGPNYMFGTIDLGPAFFWAHKQDDRWVASPHDSFQTLTSISLQHFMDFAIGATECLEMIHHSQGVVHGEIRGDAFHYNVETGRVKLITYGSGLRSFEHGLTSTGWSSLSKELGANNKLRYISPEQTGRMPAEPDSRTDIYSLGVVFWTLLAHQPVFDGDTPLDIVQGVLGRRIPNVSTIRIDVPDVIGRIIQKCTSKNVADRYHSASGLRYDLTKVQEFLSDGDHLALKEWQIASKDVSSFFVLPTMMMGRDKERADLLKVIDRVAKSHALAQRGGSNRYSDGSNLSNELPDGEFSSEGASSVEGTTRRSGSFTTHTMGSDLRARSSFHPLALGGDTATISGETISSVNSNLSGRQRHWDRHHSVSFETRSLADSLSEQGPWPSPAIDASSSLSRQLGSAKFRRRGHCEIVTIEGAGGSGKSFLVQSVLAEARRKGYCATAKFDTARRTPFGPLLKLLSSLFRQVWGERNTETPFHQALKQYVRPVWPMLHKMLGLPEFLLGPVDMTSAMTRSPSTIQPSKSTRTSMRRRGSSPDGSPRSSVRLSSSIPSAQSSQDFLRAGASTKTIRLMNTFLDVLRMFTHHKFICFCLDDLHFADDESRELITQIVGARMKMVIIVTYRPEELSREQVQKIISPPESEEFPRAGGPTVTRISLSPLSEDDILQYVSTTLCRPKEEVLPLALVIQSKTAGNPFYMREMLNTCHRKKCVWYEYRDSKWHFDLDRLFDHFQGEQDYDVLDTAFITQRLGELPSASRSILAWAALLGQTFSFELICRLLTGEFNYIDETCPEPHNTHTHKAYSQQDAVAGLQAAIQASIIIPSERDDRFRFAHDRYIQASSALKECNARKMHFVIAQTLIKHYWWDPKSRDNTASHICEAIDIIRKRVLHRSDYRRLLLECAQVATESGARPTAAKYYSNAVALLQPDPWDDSAEDVSYDETIQLYLKAAECHLYMGHHSSANVLLHTIFNSARTPLDKAPAWVLQSRIFGQSGDSKQALESLKRCLRALDYPFDADPTWEKCDTKFRELSAKMLAMDQTDLANPPTATDPSLPSLGAVLAEASSAAWWCDCVSFYHLTLSMLETHLTQGAFPQSGMAFLQVSMIALSRFSMSQFAVDMGRICLELLEKFRDPYSLARGYMLFANFVGHIQYPLAGYVHQFEGSDDYAAAAGDRISTILSFGLSAQLRFYSSENCADLEAFCQYGCEELPNWHLDTRGGTILIAVRQVCRALQGKTKVTQASDIMSDEQHHATTYKEWLETNANNGGRSLLFYETMEIVPLYLYGHYEQAIAMGKTCYERAERLWSARNTRLAMLFYALSLAGVILRRKEDPLPCEESFQTKVDETIRKIEELNEKIKSWQVVSNVNYLAWSEILEGQVSELHGNHGAAIRKYEEALDHAAEYNFCFEEALGNYLMANIFVRNAARRSARAALRESISLYRQFGANGIADHIEAEHVLILHGPRRSTRTADAGVQTDFAGDAASVQYRADGDEGEEAQPPTHAEVAATMGERMSVWRGSMTPETGAAGLPALDMIDLHAILVSSQVISSVLRVDELLKTMCDVILQTCGGSASMAAIVVPEGGPSDWCVAASGDPEKGAEAHIPGIPLSGTYLVAENVVLYCSRFREVVFLRDLISDERFGNVSEFWLQRNPLSKAVIAMPIAHGSKPLLGVLYLEGVPGSFTDRNVTVLQLLVNQIAISYSNALSMKAVEKVSAENVSMVALQKRALSKAIAAETKAKDAEAEAKRNVKLAEEAAKAKAIFLANVSHELRTPLNGVIGNSELLRDSSLNRDQLEMADSIRVSADLLLTVINDILDFSRMEADKMKLYVIAFNPEEMVREVVRAVSYSNREKPSKKNVKIIQDIDLPTMLIYGDPIRLHQVLGNLIGNSLKFTEGGSITIGARVDSDSQEKATLTFWVKDTGIGISVQQLAKLFQPFSQADASTARKYGGSGLGLSICKSLIETMMKGEIHLESQENLGTTAWFTVTFDKARPEVVAGDVQTKPLPLPEPQSRPSILDRSLTGRELSPNPYTDLTQVPKDELRICIAEDNAINSKIAIQYLSRLGYRNVDSYDNGLKAVEGLRLKARMGVPYHIMLMDVQMPVLDGYEATKMLRSDQIEAVRNILVIAMTASAIQGDREKCLAAGMNDYLAKPVRSEVLKKKLDAYIGGPSTPSEPTPRASPEPRLAPVNPVVATLNHSPLTPRPNVEETARNGTTMTLAARENAAQSRSSDMPPVAPSRASSDNRSTADSISLDDLSVVTTTTTSVPSVKRPTKKLTKNRNSTEGSLDKPRAVLQKKNPPASARQSQLADEADGASQHTGENTLPLSLSYGSGRAEDASRMSITSPGSEAGREKTATE